MSSSPFCVGRDQLLDLGVETLDRRLQLKGSGHLPDVLGGAGSANRRFRQHPQHREHSVENVFRRPPRWMCVRCADPLRYAMSAEVILCLRACGPFRVGGRNWRLAREPPPRLPSRWVSATWRWIRRERCLVIRVWREEETCRTYTQRDRQRDQIIDVHSSIACLDLADPAHRERMAERLQSFSKLWLLHAALCA